ncbi:uncharacterized protein LOC142338218 [Convolutriloba macropyga]|uniref:uncharacterized protein LOC142338218 n=1 Tax=Convolutriloba macropyga TaxID=536237 RepID=UPI003F521DB8
MLWICSISAVLGILWSLCRWVAVIDAVYSGNQEWQSLRFQLPDDTHDGRNCAKLSEHFCLKGFFRTRRTIYRSPFDGDQKNFVNLIGPIHRQINFFSSYHHRYGSCCAYQAQMYMKHGQSKGLSPRSYYDHLMDFSSYRELNFVKANYNQTLCLNQITQIGFGNGKLVIYAQPRKEFAIVNRNDGATYRFPYQVLKKRFTFDWFKRMFVCREQPWICAQFGPSLNGNSPQGS